MYSYEQVEFVRKINVTAQVYVFYHKCGEFQILITFGSFQPYTDTA